MLNHSFLVLGPETHGAVRDTYVLLIWPAQAPLNVHFDFKS